MTLYTSSGIIYQPPKKHELTLVEVMRGPVEHPPMKEIIIFGARPILEGDREYKPLMDIYYGMFKGNAREAKEARERAVARLKSGKILKNDDSFLARSYDSYGGVVIEKRVFHGLLTDKKTAGFIDMENGEIVVYPSGVFSSGDGLFSVPGHRTETPRLQYDASLAAAFQEFADTGFSFAARHPLGGGPTKISIDDVVRLVA